MISNCVPKGIKIVALEGGNPTPRGDSYEDVISKMRLNLNAFKNYINTTFLLVLLHLVVDLNSPDLIDLLPLGFAYYFTDYIIIAFFVGMIETLGETTDCMIMKQRLKKYADRLKKVSQPFA